MYCTDALWRGEQDGSFCSSCSPPIGFFGRPSTFGNAGVVFQSPFDDAALVTDLSKPSPACGSLSLPVAADLANFCSCARRSAASRIDLGVSFGENGQSSSTSAQSTLVLNTSVFEAFCFPICSDRCEHAVSPAFQCGESLRQSVVGDVEF